MLYKLDPYLAVFSFFYSMDALSSFSVHPVSEPPTKSPSTSLPVFGIMSGKHNPGNDDVVQAINEDRDRHVFLRKGSLIFVYSFTGSTEKLPVCGCAGTRKRVLSDF